MSPSQLDALGYAAASCTTLSFLPQALRVWRLRSGEDISATMYAVFLFGVGLWTVYGWMLAAWPIVIANCVTALLAGSVLWMKRYFSAVKTGLK